ncbi:MAG: archaeal flagellin FlaB [Archaeoglobaceae archaeon]|nr:archaeal flagellin FlaB [Archaeoglobaceae archaeon]
MMRRFVKNEKGFTGLEAAIVLIAFVTVAAVFSYVMLGAGFFATQKSKQVVHTGVEEASSSLELDGQYIYLTALTTGSSGEVRTSDFYVTLTAGNAKVDMNKMTLAYKDENDYVQIPFTEFLIVDDSLDCGGSDLSTDYYAVIDFESKSDITGIAEYVPRITFYNVDDPSKNCTYSVSTYDVTKNVSKNDGSLINATITPSNTSNVILPFWYYKSVIGNVPHNIIEGGEKFQIVVDYLIMAANNTTNTNEKYRFNTSYLDDNNANIYLVKLDTSSYRILNIAEYKNTTKITDPAGTNEDITIELKPSVGAPLIINKEIPPSLKDTTYV